MVLPLAYCFAPDKMKFYEDFIQSYKNIENAQDNFCCGASRIASIF